MLLFMMPRTCLVITLFIFVLVFLISNIWLTLIVIRILPWSKAIVEHIEKYQLALNNKLSLIDVNTIAVNCDNWHCQCVEHRNHLTFLCSTLINKLL